MSGSEQLIKCYMVSDNYQLHMITQDHEGFLIALSQYVEVMQKSSKDNQYIISNIF